MKADNRLLLLLGSGVSRSMGLPFMDAITDEVFTRDVIKTVHSYADRDFSPDLVAATDSDKIVKKARRFLRVVESHAQRELDERKSSRRVNYEDLLYICHEVILYSHNRYDTHLFTAALVKELCMEVKDDLIPPKSGWTALGTTALEASLLMRHIVKACLHNDSIDVKGFDLIRDAIVDVGPLSIVTLNHDLLIEQFLKSQNIEFDDGFPLQDGEARQYDPTFLFAPRAGYSSLIKLHGSLNWWLVQPPDMLEPLTTYHKHSEYVAYDGKNPGAIQNASGTTYKNLYTSPQLLCDIGKESHYNSDIFGDMMEAFTLALHRTDRVIVSGFGWNDQGVSNKLINWISRNNNNKLVLLHEGNPTGIHYRGFTWFGSQDLVRRIDTSINKFMCSTSWGQVKPLLSNSG